MQLVIYDFIFNQAICILRLYLTLHWQRSRMQNLDRAGKIADPILLEWYF